MFPQLTTRPAATGTIIECSFAKSSSHYRQGLLRTIKALIWIFCQNQKGTWINRSRHSIKKILVGFVEQSSPIELNKKFQVFYEKYPKRLMAQRCLREVDFQVAMKRKFVNHLDWKKLGRTSHFPDSVRAGTCLNVSSFWARFKTEPSRESPKFCLSSMSLLAKSQHTPGFPLLAFSLIHYLIEPFQ